MVACKKDTAPKCSRTKFTDDKGNYLIISTADWYLTKENSGGRVHLKLTGVTNADKVTLTTYGDGLNSEIPLTLNSGQVSGDMVIAFSVNARPVGPFEVSAQLKVYKNSDVFNATLNSGQLQY